MYEDTVDFFPTPADLAEELAYSIGIPTRRNHIMLPGPILEPSAGTGNLVKAIAKVFSCSNNKRMDVDCVEISANCRAILKKMAGGSYMTIS